MYRHPEAQRRETVIAIVDDDPRLLDSLKDFLESSGYAVLSFSSGELLLEGEVLDSVDCLITDIDMPVMDGVELQQRVNRRYPDLPVIFITGRPDLAVQRRIEEAGKSIFQKPFDTGVLLAAVAMALPH